MLNSTQDTTSPLIDILHNQRTHKRILWSKYVKHPNAKSTVILVPPFGEELKLWKTEFNCLSNFLILNSISCMHFDLSGCGESEGANSSFDDWIKDTISAVNFVDESEKTNIILIGFRIGAALALLAKSVFNNIQLYLVDEILDVESYFDNHYKKNVLRSIMSSGASTENDIKTSIDGCSISDNMIPSFSIYKNILNNAYEINDHIRIVSGKKYEIYVNNSKVKLSDINLKLDWFDKSSKHKFCHVISDTITSSRLSSPKVAYDLHGVTDCISFKERNSFGSVINIPLGKGNVSGVYLEGQSKKPLVIFLHGKSGYRVGPNRILLDLAVMVNKHGMSTFRFDYNGKGYSDGEIYDDQTDITEKQVDELSFVLKQILEFLKSEYGHKQVILCGMCLGGYVGVKYVKRFSKDIIGLIMLSPYYMGIESDSQSQKKLLSALVFEYFSKVFKKTTWCKAINGEISAKNIMNVFKRKLFPDKNISNLTGTAEVDIQTLLIYGSQDPLGKSTHEKITAIFNQNSETSIINNADHNFNAPSKRVEVFNKVLSYLMVSFK